MTRCLLDRQFALINYLTSSAAIFGDADGQAIDPELRGIDRGLLGIEARFSFEKRIRKIAAVFPRTFDFFCTDRDALLRDFVAACPPFAIGRLENAGQFYDFLSNRWHHEPPSLPFLRDVATCELAIAAAHIFAENKRPPEAATASKNRVAQVRRSRAVTLFRSAYDMRPLFEQASAMKHPVERDVPLAIIARRSTDRPEIFELLPVIFDLLASLDEWVDRSAIEQWEGADGLLGELSDAQLVEVCG